MNKIFILLFACFLLFETAAFAENETVDSSKDNTVLEEKTIKEDKDKEKEEDEEAPSIIDYKYFPAKRVPHKNRLQKSHKMEHYETMSKIKPGHNKNKADFKRRIDVELQLLKKEYEDLDYHP